MRIFRNLREAITETARELFSRGVIRYVLTRQGRRVEDPAKELIGYGYIVTEPNDYDKLFEEARRITGKDFLREEIAERWFNDMIQCICSNPQQHWFMHPELEQYYRRFVYDEEFKGESYTYCQRIGLQIDKVIDLLIENPERRAAVIAIWDPDVDIERIGAHRVPCSMFYQFIATREAFGYRLDVVYVERSCDFVWFYAFDVYRASRLLDYVVANLNELGGKWWVKGHLIHFIGSLHAFESDVKDQFKW